MSRVRFHGVISHTSSSVGLCRGLAIRGLRINEFVLASSDPAFTSLKVSQTTKIK